MKRISLIICVVVIFSALLLPSFANEDYLIDNADLLSGSEEAELEAMLEEVSNRLQADIVVLTEMYIDTDAQTYADDYFDYNGYGYGDGEDGMLLLVAFGDGYWHISTCGICNTGLNEEALDYISEDIVEDLQNGEYAKCFKTYIERCDETVTLARKGESYKAPFQFGGSLLISVVIGLVLGLIITGVMASKLKTVHKKAAAADYMKPGSLAVTVSRDTFLYRQVSRSAKATSSSSSGSHTSSSGRSHGGTGGKF